MPTCYRHPDRETYIRCQRCDRPICPDCMRSAAVGFQCPSCVAEGARSTRQGRTAYGGRRSSNPALTTLVLVGLNAVVWLSILASGGSTSRVLQVLGLRASGLCEVGRNGYALPEPACLAGRGTWLPGVADGAWWQPLTSMFTHVEIWHIGFNMLALFFLGPQLESIVGRTRFLAIYLLSGLTGSAAVFLLASQYGITVGASGAIFGLIGGLVVVVHKVGGNLAQLGGWLLLNAILTFSYQGISWQAHVGGFLGGLVVTAALVYAPKTRRELWQGGALAAYCVALVVVFLVRVGQLG